MFGKIGGTELIVILVIVLLIFGPSKLPALARSMGQAMKEFKKGTQDIKDDFESTINEIVDEPKK